MQIQSKHLLTALVVAGISAVAFPAKAATFATGDLILGFRSNTTTTQTLLVNLGSATALRDANSSTGTTLINIGSALTDAFGATWATQTDLFWGAAGVYSSSDLDPVVNGDPARTVYATKAHTSLTDIGVKNSGTASVSTDGGMSTISGNIAALQQTFIGSTAAYNGGLAAIVSTGANNNWEDLTTASNDFGSGFNWEGVVGTSPGNVLDLYRILADTTGASPTGTLRSGSWEGTISLGTDGAVTFASTAAVPEPSRTLLAFVGIVGLFMRRRRA